MVKLVTSSSDYQVAVDSAPIVVVDFYADWCGPCRAISPEIERMDAEMNADGAATAGKISFIKVNVDHSTEVAQKMQIAAMPTFIIYRGGKVLTKVVGAAREKLHAAIQDALVEPVNAPETAAVEVAAKAAVADEEGEGQDEVEEEVDAIVTEAPPAGTV